MRANPALSLAIALTAACSGASTDSLPQPIVMPGFDASPPVVTDAAVGDAPGGVSSSKIELDPLQIPPVFDVYPDTGFQCLEDTFGQNDTIAGAFQTPVAQQNAMFAALTSLCPAMDKDNYALSISTPSTVKVTTTWDLKRAP